MLNNSITGIRNVEELFGYFINDLHLNFHPDTDFSEYINDQTGNGMFTVEEVRHYNDLVDQCFIVCKNNHVDIYELGLGIFMRIFNDR